MELNIMKFPPKNPIKGKRKLKRVTMEVKKEIVTLFESGLKAGKIAAMYHLPRSTISSMLRNKEAIKASNVAKGVKSLTKQRSQTLEEVEKLLYEWIKEKIKTSEKLSEGIICSKAKELYADILQLSPTSSCERPEVFKASHGWYEKFRRRIDILNPKQSNLNWTTSEMIFPEFSEYVKAEGFTPQQVFSCDETTLQWKKTFSRSHFTQYDNIKLGCNGIQEKISLLLCANASGELKLKPLVVYQNENPTIFKKHSVIKSKLGVMWKANSQTSMTKQFFIEWFHEVFGPTVRQYLLQNNLPLRALLVLNETPAYSAVIEDDILEEFSFVNIKFLPPDLINLVQPLNQEVMSMFKKLYTRSILQRCSEVTMDAQITVDEFWYEYFNIIYGINLLLKAWKELPESSIKQSWIKLWPSSCPKLKLNKDSDALLTNNIISLGKSLGYEITYHDIQEITGEFQENYNSCETPETKMELSDIKIEQSEMVPAEICSDKEEKEEVPAEILKEMCSKWIRIQNFIKKNHPDKEMMSQIVEMFSGQVMSHFKYILKRREQSCHDWFMWKVPKFETL